VNGEKSDIETTYGTASYVKLTSLHSRDAVLKAPRNERKELVQSL
jgi:hypothetical protein